MNKNTTTQKSSLACLAGKEQDLHVINTCRGPVCSTEDVTVLNFCQFAWVKGYQDTWCNVCWQGYLRKRLAFQTIHKATNVFSLTSSAYCALLPHALPNTYDFLFALHLCYTMEMMLQTANSRNFFLLLFLHSCSIES